MKLSKSWLQEWIPQLDAASDSILERLTLAGIEVDNIDKVDPDFKQVWVAEVLAVENHPSRPDLRVCLVSHSNGKNSTVCGARNVRVGLRTAYAANGSTLPGNQVVEARIIDGVGSEGMLCSWEDLGIDHHSDGIIELEHTHTVGSNIAEVLKLEDVSIDFDLTPNRGDCFSILGIAREVAVLTATHLVLPQVTKVKESIDDRLPIKLNAPSCCPLYFGRIVKNVDVKVRTPTHINHRLKCAGIRPINVVVDILNYVMLELGQPMHAFDLDSVVQGIVVDKASSEDRLTTLEGTEIQLDENTLVIASDDVPVAMAGVIGAHDSGVSVDTQNIFLEVAFFTPYNIFGTARRFGLQTEASIRFERGVDYSLQQYAMDRACKLLEETTGGDFGPICEAISEPYMPKLKQIELRKTRIEQLIGTRFDDGVITDLLEQLGCTLESKADGWRVTPPKHRFDLTIEEDLIEEICRIVGYDQLPSKPVYASLDLRASKQNRNDALVLRAKLVSLGYNEVINYSFIDQSRNALFCSPAQELELVNPMSIEKGCMRSSLLPGLLDNLSSNLARQPQFIRLFEYGQCFTYQESQLQQDNHIGGVVWGLRNPESWANVIAQVDFFDVKSEVETITCIKDLQHLPSSCSWLHHGSGTDLFDNDQYVGSFGKISDEILKRFDLEGDVFVFEFKSDLINTSSVQLAEDVSKYPSVRRDLALILDRSVVAGDIQKEIQSIVGGLLKECTIFDLFESPNLGKNKKSLGVAMVFQHSERTLTEEEVTDTMNVITQQLSVKYDSQLRQ